MKIGNIRFWRNGLGIRSSNFKTHDQPLEFGLHKRWGMPEFKIYEDESESGGTDVRVAAGFLWFYVNSLLFHANRETRRWDDSCRQWGFYFMDRYNFVFRWGKKYFSFDFPFMTKVFVKHEILSLDRKRVVYCYKKGILDFEAAESVKKENRATFPYQYELLNGECQNVQATIVVERWTRRWKWTPFNHVEDSVWINFSEEVGPKRGSWKGGVTGCGWTLKAGETAVQCLRRMERDRRFER